MPTVFAHALVPLAVGCGLGPRIVPPRLLLAGVIASMLPDADVVGFKFGIAYAEALGHRGASHSLVFAFALGLLAAVLHRPLRCKAGSAFAFIVLAAASHPLLDMLTNGGLGVAWWWPFDARRLFAPWQVIEVSPFANRFFSARGLQVLASELRWIGLPALAMASMLAAARGLLAQARRRALRRTG